MEMRDIIVLPQHPKKAASSPRDSEDPIWPKASQDYKNPCLKHYVDELIFII
jgi:hypothetical protein